MILVDSGVLIAALISTDPAHQRVRLYLRENRETVGLPAVTIAEIAHFIGKAGNVYAEARFLRLIAAGTYPLLDPLPADYLRAADLVEKYADFPLGTVDALIVAMAERFGVTTILTLDQRHFGAVKPLHCERFVLAP